MTVSPIQLLIQLHALNQINLQNHNYVLTTESYQPKYIHLNKKFSNALSFYTYYLFAGAKHKNFLAEVQFQTMSEIEIIGRRDQQQNALKETYDIRVFQIDVKVGEKNVKAIGYVDTQDM